MQVIEVNSHFREVTLSLQVDAFHRKIKNEQNTEKTS